MEIGGTIGAVTGPGLIHCWLACRRHSFEHSWTHRDMSGDPELLRVAGSGGSDSETASIRALCISK